MATASLGPAPAKKVNYLNNRDILKEIHLSKNTYCWFRDRDVDHQFDIILPGVSKINQRTIAEARRNRADRIKRETGETVDPRAWKPEKNRDRKEIKSKLGYSRIGLGNV